MKASNEWPIRESPKNDGTISIYIYGCVRINWVLLNSKIYNLHQSRFNTEEIDNLSFERLLCMLMFLGHAASDVSESSYV